MLPEYIKEHIRAHTDLTKLDVSTMGLDDEDVSTLANLLVEHHVALVSLNLSNNNIRGGTIKNLLTKITSIRYLDLSRNNINDRATEDLASFPLEELNLSDNRSITPAGWEFFITGAAPKKLLWGGATITAEQSARISARVRRPTTEDEKESSATRVECRAKIRG